jgi:simple sugar transport system ATP-binding protein
VVLPQGRASRVAGRPIVGSLRDVHAGEGRERLDGVSLALRGGEITAIAGVSGNGQLALAALLCGMLPARSGEVHLPSHGIARVPEDRHGTGVIGDLPVWENAVSERLRSPELRKGPFVRRKAARARAQAIVQAFDVRGAGLDAPARSLSGGNMQKLILGRALHGTMPRLIVAHQPTWGLDVGAVAYVQQQLLAARDAGAAVLLVSDDLDEVLALGDRIAVMHGGHLTPALPAGEWTRETIGLSMAGVPLPPLPGAGRGGGTP